MLAASYTVCALTGTAPNIPKTAKVIIFFISYSSFSIEYYTYLLLEEPPPPDERVAPPE